MTIKEYLKKIGWIINCETHPARSMTARIGFVNADGDVDETEFDCEAYSQKELSSLFKDFCKENKYKSNTVRYITIVELRECKA